MVGYLFIALVIFAALGYLFYKENEAEFDDFENSDRKTLLAIGLVKRLGAALVWLPAAVVMLWVYRNEVIGVYRDMITKIKSYVG